MLLISSSRIEIIRLGVGDVSLPLPTSVISALHTSVDEMADISTFRATDLNRDIIFSGRQLLKMTMNPEGLF